MTIKPEVATTGQAAFDDAVERFLREYFERYPNYAAGLGFHAFDGRVPDLRGAAIDAWADRLRVYRAVFEETVRDELDANQQLDLDTLRLAVANQIFDNDMLHACRRNPMDYLGALDVSGYVKRDYAPLVTRIDALTQHLGHIPEVLGHARENLETPVPEPFVTTSIQMFQGTIDFLQKDLEDAIKGLPRDAKVLKAAFKAARTTAVAALTDFVAFLEELKATGETTPDFAIGAEAYAAMLWTGEGVDVPLERLIEIGEADLERNKASLASLAQAIDPDCSPAELMERLMKSHPTEATLLTDTTAMLDELHDWIVEHDLVSIPSGGQLLVAETPGFLRWAFAWMSSPGAFEETANESYYYVTPPEPEWPAARKEEWLTKFGYSKLRDVSMHEAYPGHFVHFQHYKRVPSKVRRIFGAYSFWEAWAHYSEQLMVEAGFRPDDLELRLAQMSEAILRDVRYLVAIRMHTQGMSVDDAARMFETEAMLAPAPARQEAIRGTFDPGYLNYTLGKLMLLKLREDVKARAMETGVPFSLRRFHDDFLSYGAPPVPIVRRAMLGDTSAPL